MLCNAKFLYSLQISSEHLYETTQSYKDFVPNIIDLSDLEKSHFVLENPQYSDNPGKLTSKIEAILARLVSDYRAIFAIEEEALCSR